MRRKTGAVGAVPAKFLLRAPLVETAPHHRRAAGVENILEAVSVCIAEFYATVVVQTARGDGALGKDGELIDAPVAERRLGNERSGQVRPVEKGGEVEVEPVRDFREALSRSGNAADVDAEFVRYHLQAFHKRYVIFAAVPETIIDVKRRMHGEGAAGKRENALHA